MKKCSHCNNELKTEYNFICTNCGKIFCPECRELTKSICPVCYHDVDYDVKK